MQAKRLQSKKITPSQITTQVEIKQLEFLEDPCTSSVLVLKFAPPPPPGKAGRKRVDYAQILSTA